MNRKHTKRALCMSFVSLLLCCSMLVGSTFAWFTDEASTSVNKIESGTLKVDLVDAEGNSLKGKTLQFKTKDDRTENILWEPGCTYELPEVYVVNKGNLALKYNIVITGIAGNAKLNEVIEWTINNAEAGKYYELQPNAKSNAITIKGHMKESADNTYQDLSIDGIGITVYATQLNHENDSYGPDYDMGATVHEPLVFNTDATFSGSIKANGSDGALQATGGTLTIDTNGTIDAMMGEDGYAMAVWANGGDVVINNGNFIQTNTGEESSYDLIYAKNATVTINGGTFQSATPQWTLNANDNNGAFIVKGGRFYQFNPSAAKTEPGQPDVTTNWVHEDYKVVQNGDWYEVVEKMEYTTIDSLAEFVDFANAVTANTAYKGFTVANNKYITVTLTTDLDLTGVTGPSANAGQMAIGNGNNTAYHGTFDGNGHTISNYTITGDWSYYRGLFRTVAGKFTMKNVTFDTVKNTSGVGVATTKTRNIGVVVGAVGGGEVTFENITIKNAHVEGSYSTGLIFGAANAGKINVINCKLENSVIETKKHIDTADKYHYAGALFTNVDTTYGGCIGTISGNTTSNVTWKVVDSTDTTGMKDVTSDLVGYQVDSVAYDINGIAK